MTIRQLIKRLVAFPNPKAKVLIFAKETIISESLGKIEDKRGFLILVTRERLKKNASIRQNKTKDKDKNEHDNS